MIGEGSVGEDLRAVVRELVVAHEEIHTEYEKREDAEERALAAERDVRQLEIALRSTEEAANDCRKKNEALLEVLQEAQSLVQPMRECKNLRSDQTMCAPYHLCGRCQNALVDLTALLGVALSSEPPRGGRPDQLPAAVAKSEDEVKP